jgi:hypothetical protein
VDDGEGGTATGYGTETQADFGDFAERAETRAVGRALALMGFGTEFVGQDLTEGEHVADAPVATDGLPKNPTSSAVSSNGHAPEPPMHPTTEATRRPAEEDITALTTLAVVECREDADVFGQRLRTIMKLKPSASVAPKLLTRTMTMAQYQEVLAYYERLQAQLARRTEVSDGFTAQAAPVAEPAQPPPQEAPPTGPFGSSPAPATADAEGPTAVGGPGQPANPAAVYATREEIAALKKLAAQVDPEAAEDLQDVLDHAPKGLVPDLYRRIEARLQARLHGKPTAAVA